MKKLPKQETPGMALFFGLFLIIPFFLNAQPLWAVATNDEIQAPRLKLNRILKSLMEENRAMEAEFGKEKGILDELDLIDRRLVELEAKREGLAAEMELVKKQLPELAQQLDASKTSLQSVRSHLAAHVRLMYGLGEQGILKVILSQGSIARARQGILYYGRLIQARNAQFAQFREGLKKLRLAIALHEKQLGRVQHLGKELDAGLVELQEKKGERENLLVRIRQKKDLHQKKVQELGNARTLLSSFVSKLNSTLKDEPERLPKASPVAVKPNALQVDSSPPALAVPSPRPDPGRVRQKGLVVEATQEKAHEKAQGTDTLERIVQRKGHLFHPVSGSGVVRPPGLFFGVAKKTVVRSVHRGQVVYADWFRGYGLLVILNHGDHVYTLYGHNQKLLVQPGDWVEEKEHIADSGDTGSLNGTPGLYFEIRRQGQTENPQLWLQS